MKYNSLLKIGMLVAIINMTACCCGNGLWNDQRAVTPALVEYAPADPLLGEFSNSVNNFDH